MFRASRLILSIAFLFSAFISLAQLQLDDKDWEDNKDEYRYDTEIVEEESSNTSSYKSPFNDNSFNINKSAELIKLIFFIVILGVILFFIYKLILSNMESGKEEEGLIFMEDLKEVEENLMRADLDKLLEKFINAKDYRSSIRVQYLQIIQTLSKQKYIKWAKQKTDFDYVQELHDVSFLNDFKDTTLIYESVWFGREKISERRFYEMTELSNNLIQLIQ